MKDKYLEIIVKGNLGDKLHESKKQLIWELGTIAALIAILSAIPPVKGIAAFALAPLVALTGLEIR